MRIGSIRLEGLRPGELRALTATERDRLVAGSQRRSRSSGSPGLSRMVVSMDGPGSSGELVGAAAALELGFRFCDTGVLYRALAWLALERGMALGDADAPDAAALVHLVDELELAADEQGRLRRVLIGGEDVTQRLHAAAVDRVVSAVAREPAVRQALLPVQRRLADDGPIVVAGRDIGSVVFPDADLKLYLDVSLDERARRRARERDVAPASPEAAESATSWRDATASTASARSRRWSCRPGRRSSRPTG